MRASISGTNGDAQLRISLLPNEKSHLFAGLAGLAGAKLKVEGDVSTGLRITAGGDGFTPQMSEDALSLTFPVERVSAAHEPVTMADLVAQIERDDTGPFLRTQPFPLPFVPKDRRRTAKKRLEEFEQEHPKAFADRLFRSTAHVIIKTPTQVAWTFENIFSNGAGSSRVARITCSTCPETAEITQRNILHDEVTSKKFKQLGWWIKGKTATCPHCQPKHLEHEDRPPRDIVQVVDNVTSLRKQSATIEVLKAAVAEVNRLVAELNDPGVRLRLLKNQIIAEKLVPL